MSYRRKDKAIVDKLTPKKSLRRCNLKDVIESPSMFCRISFKKLKVCISTEHVNIFKYFYFG